MPTALESLSAHQRDLLASWLPGMRVLRDHSWGLVATTVLEVERDGARYIVKAGGATDSHIARELQAHREWLEPWTSSGRAPRLAFGDEGAKLAVTHYLDGTPVLDAPGAHEPDIHRQAGALLAQLHEQQRVEDPTYEARVNGRALEWLDGPHRIDAGSVQHLREMIASWPTPSAVLVPTHGDWQPRNWLVHDGEVRAIDFGRAALRPAMTDLVRLSSHEFRLDDGLEAAFLDGYGADPRSLDTFCRELVREAIGAAAWAHLVGDEAFEARGLASIAELLDRAEP